MPPYASSFPRFLVGLLMFIVGLVVLLTGNADRDVSLLAIGAGVGLMLA